MSLKRFYLNCNDGIPAKRVHQIVSKYGKDVLIGIDPGLDDSPADEVLETLQAIKETGARLHVYLVGPGMWSWSEEERQQITRFAESVGVDTSQKDWHKEEWLDWGWRDKVISQILWYKAEYDVYSVEIDNIDSALEQDADKTVDYYSELALDLKLFNNNTKLMMKNLNEEQLEAVIKATDDPKSDINKDFLCEWAMFEEGSGDPDKQIELCKKIDIKAVTPISGITDTNHYGVVKEGVPYDLDNNDITDNEDSE